VPSVPWQWSWDHLTTMSGFVLIARNIPRSLLTGNSQHGGKLTCYCYFDGLYALPSYGGSVTALLGMDIPSLKKSHIVAVDENGVVDPADNAPAHVELGDYVFSRLADGVVFHSEFLAVKRA